MDLYIEVPLPPIQCAQCGFALDASLGKRQDGGLTVEVLLVVPCPYCAEPATADIPSEPAVDVDEVFDRR